MPAGITDGKAIGCHLLIFAVIKSNTNIDMLILVYIELQGFVPQIQGLCQFKTGITPGGLSFIGVHPQRVLAVCTVYIHGVKLIDVQTVTVKAAGYILCTVKQVGCGFCFIGCYAIDVHEERPNIIRDTTQIFERYKTGESYGVPYRILCPRDLDNVLVAGRTVSCDRLSNGSLRVMPCCMNEGEAAGIAAKLAGDMEQVNIHRVDTQILRRRLMEEGAFLPKLPTDTF